MFSKIHNQKGFTVVEIIITVLILSVLASVAMPMAKLTVKRTKELELRRNLRILRDGIDKFKEEYDKARKGASDSKEDFRKILESDRKGYPNELDELVKLKVLRRLPPDPMTGKANWETRSYNDDPDTWSGDKEIFDVRSASRDKAIDGTEYNTW